MTLAASLRVHPFEAHHASEVAALVLHIQQGEFGSPVTLADQPDLADIPAHYQVGRGGFWVGLDGAKVVGSVGLLDAGASGILRKMFVHVDYRGRATGLAQALLDALLGHAREKGLGAVTLGTQERLRAARRFYERNGFRAIDPAELPAGFLRMKVDTHFYTLDLP